jgi:hypothetical protein
LQAASAPTSRPATSSAAVTTIGASAAVTATASPSRKGPSAVDRLRQLCTVCSLTLPQILQVLSEPRR